MMYHDFLTNVQRVIHKWLHHLPIYEKHFKRFVNQSVVFFEIGVFMGGSLQLWERFLGPFATIVGIDINPECRQYGADRINIRIGDQSDTVFLQELINEFGRPDIVLDDGSHIMKDVRASFKFLYDQVSENGIYFVEDLHTAYYPQKGGGLDRGDTFIDQCKTLIDYLNAYHNGLPRDFSDITHSMTFYNSIAVFEKIKWTNDSLDSIVTANEQFAEKLKEYGLFISI